jgi:UDP-N-acetylglucosamine--N-acetylmuramyl-(pentapeptide) pyrophosphoryl-undecaprenol N-acetylglucosamine transferase
VAKNNMKKLKVIISGGGTGGHIYPAVAVAQALQKRMPDVEILFVGASDRMEMEKVPKEGYKIVGLWISGLQRSLSAKNLLFPIKVISSVWKSLQILKAFKPDVAIGFGGYASGEMLYAATMKKTPSVIHEQNSYAGITNKILKNRVNTICVAYDKMERFFPERKIVKTGNPIRQDLLTIEHHKSEAIKFFNLDSNKKTVLVIGGSLGARTINESIFAGLKKLEEAGLQMIWQTGKNFPQADSIHNPQFAIRNFIYEMNFAYAAADIVVSRAGALSIAELAQVKKPVILVPSPNVAEDHQTKNAMALVDREAAILVKDMDAKNVLIDEVISLANDNIKQVQLKNNIATFAMPNAAEKIVDEVMRAIGEK